MASGNVDGGLNGGSRRWLGSGMGVWVAIGLCLGSACALVGCAGAAGDGADVPVDGASAEVGSPADVGVVVAERVAGERVFVPGPWVRVYAVREADSRRVIEQERRTASEVGADGRWQVRFERARVGREEWRLERTLTMMRTSEGVAMVKLEDATRDMVYAFEPSLVLAPGVIAGLSEAKAKTTQGDDVGEAIATIVPLGVEDGMTRVRTTLTLVQGRTRVERVSELTLGTNGSVRERNERSVRWGRIRVDHADEVLEEVGEGE